MSTAEEYIYVQWWGERNKISPALIEERMQQAADEDAPLNAIYRTGDIPAGIDPDTGREVYDLVERKHARTGVGSGIFDRVVRVVGGTWATTDDIKNNNTRNALRNFVRNRTPEA